MPNNELDELMEETKRLLRIFGSLNNIYADDDTSRQKIIVRKNEVRQTIDNNFLRMFEIKPALMGEVAAILSND